MIYKKQMTPADVEIVIASDENGRNISFAQDPANTDYQEYLKWLAEGNQPLPADEQE